MSTIIDVADAMVTGLSSLSASMTFEVERAYIVDFELPDLSTTIPKVSVVPNDKDISMATRDGLNEDLQIDIGIQLKVVNASAASVDPVMTFSEEIEDYIRATGEFNISRWIKTKAAVIYSPAHLKELLTFTRVMTFTMKVIR